MIFLRYVSLSIVIEQAFATVKIVLLPEVTLPTIFILSLFLTDIMRLPDKLLRVSAAL